MNRLFDNLANVDDAAIDALAQALRALTARSSLFAVVALS
jgi:hypothetical protein